MARAGPDPLLDVIAAATITLVVRHPGPAPVRPGGSRRTPVGVVEFTAVDRADESDLTAAHAGAAGCPSGGTCGIPVGSATEPHAVWVITTGPRTSSRSHQFINTASRTRATPYRRPDCYAGWGDAVTSTHRVVVCSGDPVNLAGLRAVLDGAGAGPTAPCNTIAELATVAIRQRADVLVVDDDHGAFAPASLRAAVVQAGVRGWPLVLVVSGPRAPENALRAARAGVPAVAHRAHDPRFLTCAVASARSGRRWLDPQLAAEIVMGNAAAPLANDVRDRLTAREKEVLDGLCTGMSNAELAGRMAVSERTVKFHVSNVFTKLGVRSREQAIVMSFANPHPVPETRTDPVL